MFMKLVDNIFFLIGMVIDSYLEFLVDTIVKKRGQPILSGKNMNIFANVYPKANIIY